MSSFAKGNPFSLFFGTPFLGPLFSCFFLFFVSPAKVGSLEMQPGAKLQAYLGVIILQPHACTQRFRLRILHRTRSFPGRTSARSLSGRIESIWETPSKERGRSPRGAGSSPPRSRTPSSAPRGTSRAASSALWRFLLAGRPSRRGVGHGQRHSGRVHGVEVQVQDPTDGLLGVVVWLERRAGRCSSASA